MTEEQQKEWVVSISEAVKYLIAASDFVPNNQTILRHVGKLSKTMVDISQIKPAAPVYPDNGGE